MIIKPLKAAFLIYCLFLVFKANASSSEYLEGVWVLNTTYTIEQSGKALPQKVLNSLNSNKAMSYVFRKNKTTYTPLESIDEQDDWFEWDLISESVDSITINIYNEKQIRFSKLKECLGLPIEKYAYTEYYCKENK
ncbi:MAG: hypothetical protein P8M49_12915 [Thalassotalea sp.]|nr:hypothetical protein [Thalassotalea sp.]MDG2394412.1 hypothetical protein [Thalassotalea sp.]